MAIKRYGKEGTKEYTQAKAYNAGNVGPESGVSSGDDKAAFTEGARKAGRLGARAIQRKGNRQQYRGGRAN